MPTENTEDKLSLLFAAAEFDVCAPSQSLFSRKNLPGIYLARLPNGQCMPLFKVLLTNRCEYNCLYCANRKNRNVPRTEFSPDELAKTFMNYLRKGHVKGLFLSSAIQDNSSKTMGKMIECCEILRKKYRYPGYIHLKILPAVSSSQIEEAANLANRLSLNLEAPNPMRLKRLAPEKDFFAGLLDKLKELSTILKKREKPPSLTTQLVVGAAGETDTEILSRISQLRKEYSLGRVYFSAFAPISNTPLEDLPPTPILRERRLYQVDWLLSYYDFAVEEIPVEADGNLALTKDPKLIWAERNIQFFPLEINQADYLQLLRIPGIGPLSAKRIIEKKEKGKDFLVKRITFFRGSDKKSKKLYFNQWKNSRRRFFKKEIRYKRAGTFSSFELLEKFFNKMKTISAVIASLLCFACVQKKEYKLTRVVMGTIGEITYYDLADKKFVESAFQEIEKLEKLASKFYDKSDVAKINQTSGIKPIKVSKEVFEVIERSVYYSNMCNGAFDITVGPLMDIWGKSSNVPKEEEIRNVLELVSYRNIQLDPSRKTVFLKKRE